MDQCSTLGFDGILIMGGCDAEFCVELGVRWAAFPRVLCAASLEFCCFNRPGVGYVLICRRVDRFGFSEVPFHRIVRTGGGRWFRRSFFPLLGCLSICGGWVCVWVLVCWLLEFSEFLSFSLSCRVHSYSSSWVWHFSV
ncbi:hypothetical protein U1Q18_044178 [Sarracenia purpurea var. burkii]